MRGTKGDIRQEDSLRTIVHEEGGVAGGPTSLRAQPPYYSRLFLYPLGAIFFDRIEYPGFESLEDQVVGTFHLGVTPWMSHGGIVHIKAALLVEVLEFRSGEGRSKARDDLVGHSEPVRYFFDELGCLSR